MYTKQIEINDKLLGGLSKYIDEQLNLEKDQNNNVKVLKHS